MAVVTCYIPSDNSVDTSQRYYICDTVGELPVDNATGDLAYTKSTGDVWKATGPGVWAPISGGGSSETFQAENKDTVTILTGQLVTIHPSGSGVILAIATSTDTACNGFAMADIPVGVVGTIATDGLLYMADWTNVTGSPSLTPRKQYFLQATAGLMSLNPPGSSTQISQPVGKATDPQTLDITLLDPVIIG